MCSLLEVGWARCRWAPAAADGLGWEVAWSARVYFGPELCIPGHAVHLNFGACVLLSLSARLLEFIGDWVRLRERFLLSSISGRAGDSCFARCGDGAGSPDCASGLFGRFRGRAVVVVCVWFLFSGEGGIAVLSLVSRIALSVDCRVLAAL